MGEVDGIAVDFALVLVAILCNVQRIIASSIELQNATTPRTNSKSQKKTLSLCAWYLRRCLQRQISPTGAVVHILDPVKLAGDTYVPRAYTTLRRALQQRIMKLYKLLLILRSQKPAARAQCDAFVSNDYYARCILTAANLWISRRNAIRFLVSNRAAAIFCESELVQRRFTDFTSGIYTDAASHLIRAVRIPQQM